MSNRAAWRLESLGFTEVYRYAAGKLDWFAFGLPLEGEYANIPKAGDVVRRNVPTCQPGDQIGKVHEESQARGWKVCVVVNDSNVVLGRLRGSAWEVDPETTVEDVMENGPTTFRPDNFLEPLTKRMREKKVGTVIVTNSDGVLIGILYRKDAEEHLSRDRERQAA